MKKMNGEIGTTTTNKERWGGKKTRFKEGELSRKREMEAFSEELVSLSNLGRS